MTTLKRKIMDDLLQWKEESQGRTALMIEGARRIGKTTVAKEFGRLHYAACATIDFSRGESSPVKRIMTEEYSNLDKFFFDLQSIAGKTFVERDTLIIFDEVQSFPPARQMIKSLVEDGRYDYIETGSLISIKQNVKDILIPSGERKIRMHPMDFEEFLWANDDYATMDRIRYCFEHQEPLGESVHRKIMNMFSTYMLIGGMPEAVCRYIEKNGPKDIETVKRSVIDLYIEDSGKIPGIGVKCRMMLSRLPQQLSRHEKSFSPSDIRKGSRTREYIDAAYALGESRIVNLCLKCDDPGPAPALFLDENRFKMYLVDTGLLYTMQQATGDMAVSYQDALGMKLGINKGMLFENMVQQILTMGGYELMFQKFDWPGSDHKQEVDFLIPRPDGVDAVEVKSSRSDNHISLDRLAIKYGKHVERKIVVHSKDLRKDGDTLYIPIYMTSCLRSPKPTCPTNPINARSTIMSVR